MRPVIPRSPFGMTHVLPHKIPTTAGTRLVTAHPILTSGWGQSARQNEVHSADSGQPFMKAPNTNLSLLGENSSSQNSSGLALALLP